MFGLPEQSDVLELIDPDTFFGNHFGQSSIDSIAIVLILKSEIVRSISNDFNTNLN